jgi:hypothetical protein
MVLRLLIAAQIAWVAALGVVARGIFPPRPFLGWAESAIGLAFLPALVAFPVLVSRSLGRAGLPPWKRRAVAGIEAILCLASFLAVLPAVQ